MGERLLCKQEVIGSIPFTSTILRRVAADRSDGKSSEFRVRAFGRAADCCLSS